MGLEVDEFDVRTTHQHYEGNPIEEHLLELKIAEFLKKKTFSFQTRGNIGKFCAILNRTLRTRIVKQVDRALISVNTENIIPKVNISKSIYSNPSLPRRGTDSEVGGVSSLTTVTKKQIDRSIVFSGLLVLSMFCSEKILTISDFLAHIVWRQTESHN